jgi:methylated-DNA-[protein]-cysteine S-methyltransferase
MIRFHDSVVCTVVPGPLGPMTVAATCHGLAGLFFADQRHLPAIAHWRQEAAHPVLREAAAQVTQYFAGTRTRFELPLDLQGGTPFQQSVWHALLTIPPGATTTYGALSRHIGRPQAVRAVGTAIGRNPIGIVVPCHRVIGSDGTLTGYAGGLDRKSALLRLEGVAH